MPLAASANASSFDLARVVFTARHERFALRDVFTISRGSKTHADVVVVTAARDGKFGRGEAVPYARYGESVSETLADIASYAQLSGSERLAPQHSALTGAALNAVDCALWDLQAKLTGIPVSKALGLSTLKPIVTAYTLSVASPEEMAAKARALPHLPLLKLKLAGDGDAARMRAVRAARPDARLIADANEAWQLNHLEPLLQVAAECGFATVEQPLPADADAALADLESPIPITADESVHTAADIPRLKSLYGAVNIKLDKAGGLTGALALHDAARAAGLKIMIGSMVASSLAAAPALLLAQDAEWVDLDGPLLLAQDREHGLVINNGVIQPANAALWG